MSSTRSGRSTTPSSTSRSPRWSSSAPARCRPTGTSTSGSGCRRRNARRTSRTSWQPTHATPCAGCRRSRGVNVVLEDHYTGDEINGAVGARRDVRGRLPRRDRGRAGRPARAVPPQGPRRAPVPAVRGAAGRRRDARGRDRAPRRRPPRRAGRAPLPRAARAPRHPRARRRARVRRCPAASRSRPPTCATGCAIARLVRTSLEANGGICRSLLRIRYELPDAEEVAA